MIELRWFQPRPIPEYDDNGIQKPHRAVPVRLQYRETYEHPVGAPHSAWIDVETVYE